jgi:hypothetical protein
MSTPTYTTITRIEINKLLELSAPRCCFPVISAINSFMFDTCHSFPSVKTIIEWCGGFISRSGVMKALKWLEDNNIISRGKARTKTRFTNKIRQVVYGAKKIKECLQSVDKRMSTECRPHEENKIEQNSITPKPPKQGVTKRQRKKSTLETRLVRAKRRVQNYTNLLNNREEQEQPNNRDKAKDLFADILRNPRPMNQEEIKMFQRKAELEEEWKWFVMAYHPSHYKTIFGVSVSPQEQQWAEDQMFKDIKLEFKRKT